MKYLIAYDIADPGRLRRVANAIERVARRCQKSVFLMDATAEQVAQCLERLRPLIDPEQDVVQAWRLSSSESALGQVCGTPVPVHATCVIASSLEMRFLSGDSP